MTIVHKHTAINTPSLPAPTRGQYMHSSTGRKIYPFDPRPEEIDIEAVAHHLACNGRWNGATQHKEHEDRIFYSVAEHSVLVAKFVREELNRPDLELEALLHDAPEYAIGDMIRPLKHSPEIYPIYSKIESLNELAVSKRFGIAFPLPKEVKIADDAVCAAEARQIVPKDASEEWLSGIMHDDSIVAPYQIEMMQPYQAKLFFLAAWSAAVVRRAQYAAPPSNFAL